MMRVFVVVDESRVHEEVRGRGEGRPERTESILERGKPFKLEIRLEVRI